MEPEAPELDGDTLAIHEILLAAARQSPEADVAPEDSGLVRTLYDGAVDFCIDNDRLVADVRAPEEIDLEAFRDETLPILETVARESGLEGGVDPSVTTISTDGEEIHVGLIAALGKFNETAAEVHERTAEAIETARQVSEACDNLCHEMNIEPLGAAQSALAISLERTGLVERSVDWLADTSEKVRDWWLEPGDFDAGFDYDKQDAISVALPDNIGAELRRTDADASDGEPRFDDPDLKVAVVTQDELEAQAKEYDSPEPTPPGTAAATVGSSGPSM